MLIQIADENIDFANELKKYLSENGNAKSFVTTTAQNTIELYNELQPDILILELKFSDSTGIEVIDNISQNAEEMKCNILILSDYSDEVIIKNTSKIFKIYDKFCEFEVILENIRKIYDYLYGYAERNQFCKERNEQGTYREIMQKLHFNFAYSGTFFLIEILDLIYSEHIESINLTELYIKIGKIKNISPNKVKWNVVKAIDYVDRYTSTSKISKIFPNYDGRKLAPKYFIGLVMGKDL